MVDKPHATGGLLWQLLEAQMKQVTSWSEMKQGEFCLEERVARNGTLYGVFLCQLDGGREEQIKLPLQIVQAIRAAGISISRSDDWD